MSEKINIKEVIKLSKNEYNALNQEDKDILEGIYAKEGWEENKDRLTETKKNFKNTIIVGAVSEGEIKKIMGKN